MASTLVDSPPAAETEPRPDERPPVMGRERPDREPGKAVPSGATCPRCGASLAPAQDWCLQCGAHVQAGSTGSGWRPAATMLIATAALVLLAAAVAVAALNRHAPKRAVRTATVAQAAPPATTPPVTTAPPLGTPGASSPLPGIGTTVKPPKIPLRAQLPVIPAVSPTGGAGGSGGSESNESSKESTNKEGGSQTGGASGEAKPQPILLDTNAAATYNPYNYAATLFGDPSLTIDGDPTTSWTAQINPETSPRLAEGVLIDLKAQRKLSSLALVSSSPGMTVQVYGAHGNTVPTSITDPAWVALSHSIVIHKHRTKIGLKHQGEGFDFVTLWISRAGEKSLGTPTAPGHVSVGEIELFPVKK